MSQNRPGVQSKFSSKGAYDALLVEDLPSDDEDDAAIIVEPEMPVPAPAPAPTSAPAPAPALEPATEPSKPLTKTQQKKAAKASKPPSKREAQKSDKDSPPLKASQTLPSQNTDSTLANGSASASASASASVSTSAATRQKEKQRRDSGLGGGPISPLPQPKALRARSRSPQGSISVTTFAEPPFVPNLPSDLPHPSQKTLVRKRKASTDLQSNNMKESKVEIEVAYGNDHSRESSIPLDVDVSSSAGAITASSGTVGAPVKKKTDVFPRIASGLALASGFFILLLAGHIYMIILVLVIQSLVFREITQLFKGTRDPWSKALNWYFFAVANYYFYGETIIYYFKHVITSEALFHPFAANHRFVSFMLYTFGFMGFVYSLEKGHLQRQFSLFGWVHMTLLVIVVSSHFIVDNILEGMIWFWVPASFVIFNDVTAWFWGVTLGRTQLFALSPKKTIEGFVGAFFSTCIIGFFFATWFMRFDYMICPVRDLGVSAWSDFTCRPNPVFIWREFELAKPVAAFLSILLGRSVTTIPWAPFQFHALAMATFASLVAPFGGFFASGFKRAFNIKDFGHSIPGHGGMTDRMDCQFLMGMFAYVYYTNLIRVNDTTVESVLQLVVNGLSRDEQLDLFRELAKVVGKDAVGSA